MAYIEVIIKEIILTTILQKIKEKNNEIKIKIKTIGAFLLNLKEYILDLESANNFKKCF